MWVLAGGRSKAWRAIDFPPHFPGPRDHTRCFLGSRGEARGSAPRRAGPLSLTSLVLLPDQPHIKTLVIGERSRASPTFPRFFSTTIGPSSPDFSFPPTIPINPIAVLLLTTSSLAGDFIRSTAGACPPQPRTIHTRIGSAGPRTRQYPSGPPGYP